MKQYRRSTAIIDNGLVIPSVTDSPPANE